MPSPDRETAAVVNTAVVNTAVDLPRELGALRRRAVDVLTRPDLAHVVDLVAWRDSDELHVAAHRGRSVHVGATSTSDGDTTVLAGVDPVGVQDPARDDAYPYAWQRLAGLFADTDRSPDLAVVHTDAHYWPETGGTLGEHGSLGAVQSRAPLLLSGVGVTARGVVDGHCRIPDVGATLTWLAGGDLDGMTGRPLQHLVSPGARQVVGLLWDGVQCADLLAMLAAGRLPAVARLVDRGVALRAGAVAEFPSVTLVNHTCALTGVPPGVHGIVNNAYYDRAVGAQVIPNSSETWHLAMDQLRPGVRTVFERVDGPTVCIDEPADRGATASTFAMIRLMRAAPAEGRPGSIADFLPPPAEDPHATLEHVSADESYAWATQVDAAGLQQALGNWPAEGPWPRLTWWNSTLTDSAHHAGGPTSEIARASIIDTDRRLGVWMDHLQAIGAYDSTVFLLTADHGSAAADPDCRGSYGEALATAGIAFRDEGHGFLYLGDLHPGEGPAAAG